MNDAPLSRDELMAELELLRTGRDSCEAFLQERRRMESALLERVKELNCLYGITRLAQNRDLSLDELALGIADLICASWQFPEITCARIRIDGREFPTRNFEPSPWRQASDVVVQGNPAGEIEVCYLKPRPEADEGPFLKEERHLLDAACDLVGRIVSERRVEEQVRALARELMMAQENERQRIARELHDHLTQDLSLIKGNLERLWSAQPLSEALRPQAGDIAERLSASIAAIRDLAYALLPQGLMELGLVNTVLRHCEEYARRNGIEVEVFADGMDGLQLDFETQINLYRLIQEFLTNTRKHAVASKVVVRFLASYPDLILRIEDDGRGSVLEECFARAGRERRMGLWSMKERVRLLDGRIVFTTRPGAGMRVRVEVPLMRNPNGSPQTHPDR